MSKEVLSFADTKVWQDARQIAKSIYSLSSNIGFYKDWALRDQIRRSVISIMANIAEGSARGTSRDFVHFLSIAMGSCAEVKSHLYLAFDLNYISNEELQHAVIRIDEISRQIRGLARSLRNSPVK